MGNLFSNSTAGYWYRPLVVIIICLLGVSTAGFTQRGSGDVGIGIHIGLPTGVTVRFYKPTTSLDLLASWDLNDYFFLSGHAIFDTHLNDDGTIHFFYGPGAFVATHRHGHHHGIGLGHEHHNHPAGHTEFGLSGEFGVDFLIERFEIFLQVMPRLSLIEATHFDLGAGVGVRYYL